MILNAETTDNPVQEMAPTVDYATIIILDIGENTATSEKHEKPFFEQAKQCTLRIIERNIMIQTKNLVGVVLLGAGKTKNALAEQCRGAFKSIAMTYELQAPTWQMIRDLPQTTTNRVGDWFEGLIVAAHHFKDGISGVKINSKKIVLITNFKSPAKVGKNFDEVVSGFHEECFEVYVIGPDLETQDSKDIQLVKQFITGTNGDTATFDEAMRGWLFHKKKASKLTPQNFDLSLGPKIKIPISAYIRVRDEPIVKNWQKAVKDPVFLTASTTEGVKRDPKIVNPVDHSVIIKEDTIEAYKYGQKVIPFSDSDKKMLYQSGERSLSLYGFTDKSNIDWQNLHGDGTYYVFGRKGDKRAQYAIECLISSLLELNLVGVVRKVHSKASEPKMFALMPVIEPNNYICLSLISLCYKDEIKNMAFPPTDLKKFACSTEQVNAFKELITAMDLTKAYKDDEYCETEAFPVAETVSPSIQYILDCISFRAMNPGKPLPQPREEIMTMFKVPPLIEKRARDPIEKLTKLFTLHKIEVKSRKKALAIPDDAGTDAEMVQIKVDEDMPKIQMPLKDTSSEIKTISTVNPVTDFEVLKNKGKHLRELAPEMTEVIETLVYTSFGGDFSKALESMKILRNECVAHDPSHYNNWLKKFKRDLTERKRDGFLNMIAEKKLDFILNSENSLSAVTEENSNDDSQMYENDTVPNTAELSIATDINDMFDEM